MTCFRVTLRWFATRSHLSVSLVALSPWIGTRVMLSVVEATRRGGGGSGLVACFGFVAGSFSPWVVESDMRRWP